MTKPESDERPLAQVIYDVFGYSPGGGLIEAGTIDLPNKKGEIETVKAYHVTLYRRHDDYGFNLKVLRLGTLIADGKLACRIVTGVKIVEKPLDNAR